VIDLVNGGVTCVIIKVCDMHHEGVQQITKGCYMTDGKEGCDVVDVVVEVYSETLLTGLP